MELWPPAMPTWGRPPSAVQSSAARLHGSRPHASGFRTLASSNAHLELWTPAMPTWGRPPSAVRSSAARLLGSKLQAPRFRLQNSGLQHCPRGDGRPRPSSRAQLDSSAPSFRPHALGFRTLASSNAHLELWTPAMPTWGRPPSAVQSSAARPLGSRLQPQQTGAEGMPEESALSFQLGGNF